MIRISKKIVLAAWLASCALSVLAQGGNIDGINTYYIKEPTLCTSVGGMLDKGVCQSAP